LFEKRFVRRMAEPQTDTTLTTKRNVDYDGLGWFARWTFQVCNHVLAKADIQMKGDRDTDMQIYRKRFARRLVKYSLGFDNCVLGESFMAGDWDVENISEFVYKLFRSGIIKYTQVNIGFVSHLVPMRLFNHQGKKQAMKDIACHYDLGLDLFGNFLDKNMNYTCAYWKNASNLDEAQINKMNLIGRKLKLEKGMKVLDLGCGYGSLANYLAETFDVEVIGVTISQDQVDYAKKHFQSNKVNIMLMDYRDLLLKRKKNNKNPDDGQPESYVGYFDRVVSVGILEHLGHKNYRNFFKLVNKLMKDDTSIYLLHTIGLNNLWMPPVEPFANEYIFKNGMLPWYTQIISETKNVFFLEDWHNMGHDYYLTLMAWAENFERNWPKIRSLLFEKERLLENDKRTKIRRQVAKNRIEKRGRETIKSEPGVTTEEQMDKEVDEELAHVFFRMWKFYLLFSAGAFKARRFNLWQVVFTKDGLVGGYQSER